MSKPGLLNSGGKKVAYVAKRVNFHDIRGFSSSVALN